VGIAISFLGFIFIRVVWVWGIIGLFGYGVKNCLRVYGKRTGFLGSLRQWVK